MSFPAHFEVSDVPLDQSEWIAEEHQPFERWDDEQFEAELYRCWPFVDNHGALRPCPKCGEPGGLARCPKCHRPLPSKELLK